MKRKKAAAPSANVIDFKGNKTMSIYTRKGEKVRYCNFSCGLDSDRESAAKYLIRDQVYTVRKVSIYRSVSRVHFEEVAYEPGFNTVLFQNIEE